MGEPVATFAKLKPESLTWLGDIRSPIRKALWSSFPGVFLPSPTALAERLMTDHKVPALSLAVAKGGTIVFSHGFGFADQQQRKPVTADSLFRIASNSKVITATAIHLLAERGLLSLSERVFGPTGMLGQTYGTKPYSNWLTQIEVKHLLEHSAGGWGNDGDDPMFKSPQLAHAGLIGATLDADLLKRPPGVEFIYSNFGYCLLGRVIEKKSGQSYEDFVRRVVLIPAGASRMQIAQDTLGGRAPDEVVYVSGGGGSPYNQPVRRMDSHGGWIASASDYVRFLLAIDNAAPPADVIGAASAAVMRDRPSAWREKNYGQGVATDGTNIWHNGMLSGSRSVMWCGTAGHAWSVVCTGGPKPGSKGKKKGDALLTALDKMMWRLWDLV
jgi:CubicO group peptidase (beta-lactamase class C family)